VVVLLLVVVVVVVPPILVRVGNSSSYVGVDWLTDIVREPP